MDGRADGRTDGRTNGRTNRWAEGRTDFPVSFSRAPGKELPRALLAGWAASSSEGTPHSLPHISRSTHVPTAAISHHVAASRVRFKYAPLSAIGSRLQAHPLFTSHRTSSFATVAPEAALQE